MSSHRWPILGKIKHPLKMFLVTPQNELEDTELEGIRK